MLGIINILSQLLLVHSEDVITLNHDYCDVIKKFRTKVLREKNLHTNAKQMFIQFSETFGLKNRIP